MLRNRSVLGRPVVPFGTLRPFFITDRKGVLRRRHQYNMAKEGRKRTVRNRKVERGKKDTTKKYESREDNVVKKD